MTDDELARLWTYQGQVKMPPVGDYEAPCAKVQWDGLVLNLFLTGAPLDPATAAQWPDFAMLLVPPEFAGEPTIAEQDADFHAATQYLPAVAPEAVFRARIATCRACTLWDELARAGMGSCASVKASCACRRLWLASETCPEAKWP